MLPIIAKSPTECQINASSSVGYTDSILSPITRSVDLNVLITGVCGFVGSSIARRLSACTEIQTLYGIDNLVRSGSETNRADLVRRGVHITHGDLRLSSDLETLPAVDWVIDAAALPNVMAGVDGKSTAKQLIEHNLVGTLNLLEYCKRNQSGLVLLSTSRVYSIEAQTRLPLEIHDSAFRVVENGLPDGVSPAGLTEIFTTESPVSLYGATKIASETMAMEYGHAFDFPVLVNRCGVIAGAGQFGRADQGIFSFWIHSHKQRRPMKYIGFGGTGHQVRDCLHVEDLATLVQKQIQSTLPANASRLVHVSGGAADALSLKQLTAWCDQRFGKHEIAASDEKRPFDLPWVVLDHSRAREVWGFSPERSLESTLEEIAQHAEANPDWLDLSNL